VVTTQGHIRGWSLSTLLQMVEIDKRTCTMRVETGDNVGLLFFRDGNLIHAETGPFRGIDAAYEIVNWGEDAEIDVDGAMGLQKVTIDLPITRLLLEGFTRRDEAQRAVAAEAVPAKRAADAPTPLRVLHGGPEADEPAAFDLSSKEEEDVSKLQGLLDRFRDEVPEFFSTDIVNIDSGLSIGGGTLDADFDASIASASYSEVVKSNRRALDLLGLGNDCTEDILISTEKVYILIRMLAGEYYHLVAIARKGNLGLARAIMKKYEAPLLQAVGQLA
jgi:predicted regulator of Ras-like GTPase activity (Roadblock/LC7/MglB family)